MVDDKLQSETYNHFAKKLFDTCIISDPWLEGSERFRIEPVFLSKQTYADMRRAAEAIGRAYEELCRLVWENPEWLDTFFHLTPYQKLMWLSSGGRWHGIARLDFFVQPNGRLQMCEMNSDTPSGEAEAVILNRLLKSRHPGAGDPNSDFENQFYDMVMACHRTNNPDHFSHAPNVGILYPTELAEDLSMITLYENLFQRHGCRVVRGSPFNLHRLPSGELTMFDVPVKILIRHYKTDWWGERLPVWSDEEDFLDPDPLDRQLRYVLEAEMANQVTVINPFGAVISQNKLAMALCWEKINLFSKSSQDTIRHFVPESYRLLDIDPATVTKDAWVLKSDYGCEGDEVIIGKCVSEEIWTASLAAAIPHRWMLQRYFESQPIQGNLIANHGMYLIGGKAGGLYTRLSKQATDYAAVSAATFVRL